MALWVAVSMTMPMSFMLALVALAVCVDIVQFVSVLFCQCMGAHSWDSCDSKKSEHGNEIQAKGVRMRPKDEGARVLILSSLSLTASSTR